MGKVKPVVFTSNQWLDLFKSKTILPNDLINPPRLKDNKGVVNITSTPTGKEYRMSEEFRNLIEDQELRMYDRIRRDSQRYVQAGSTPPHLDLKKLRIGDDDSMYQHGVTCTLFAARKVLADMGIDADAIEEVITLTEDAVRTEDASKQEKYDNHQREMEAYRNERNPYHSGGRWAKTQEPQRNEFVEHAVLGSDRMLRIKTGS